MMSKTVFDILIILMGLIVIAIIIIGELTRYGYKFKIKHKNKKEGN